MCDPRSASCLSACLNISWFLVRRVPCTGSHLPPRPTDSHFPLFCMIHLFSAGLRSISPSSADPTCLQRSELASRISSLSESPVLGGDCWQYFTCIVRKKNAKLIITLHTEIMTAHVPNQFSAAHLCNSDRLSLNSCDDVQIFSLFA